MPILGHLPLSLPLTDFLPHLPVGNALDERLHPGGAGLLHLVCDVTVNVQGKGGCGVAQVSLYSLDVIPGADRCHGIAVSEIVETGIRAANGGNDFLEASIYTGFCQMAAQFIGKHKVAVLPQRTGLQVLLGLDRPPPS